MTWDKYREEMEWKRNYWKDRPDDVLIEFSVADIDYFSPYARELFEHKIKERFEKEGIMCHKIPEEELIKMVVENFKTKLEKMVEQFINRCKQRKWSPEYLKTLLISSGCEIG